MSGRYIYKDKVLFVRQDLSCKYKIFAKPIDAVSDTIRAHVHRFAGTNPAGYDTFAEAQVVLDIEAQRKGYKVLNNGKQGA
ncbi:hypothetical protein [Phascolarctobacterium succinatutens]|jgi:hypothetical protein|uniref:hypothetical protein n=1 Tax=Phascolarctobacterium succinatutens TaxID=626940 RepID=UPI00204D0D1B|nr:hypothetical protein [Phascolarctobacterium succinatutens]DAR29297.1 MAG TPA: hypothetical protein [Caudoviricetes sp.]